MRMIVAQSHGHLLTYDTADIAEMGLCTPRDVHDVTRPEDVAIRRELGDQHLHLYVKFKPGCGAVWINEEELKHG